MAIGKMEMGETKDPIHKIYPRHTPRIKKMISMIPKIGCSRGDLPDEYRLKCHKKKNVGFHDVYGRLRWDDVSSTLTGGCLNPSKGRFLHPLRRKRCITAREAALLQTFSITYKFAQDIPFTLSATQIGQCPASSILLHSITKHFDHLNEHMEIKKKYLNAKNFPFNEN